MAIPEVSNDPPPDISPITDTEFYLPASLRLFCDSQSGNATSKQRKRAFTRVPITTGEGIDHLLQVVLQQCGNFKVAWICARKDGPELQNVGYVCRVVPSALAWVLIRRKDDCDRKLFRNSRRRFSKIERLVMIFRSLHAPTGKLKDG